MADALVVRHAEDILRQVSGVRADKRVQLDAAVEASWVRCVNVFNIDPSRSHAVTILDGTGLRERKARNEILLRFSEAEMESLYGEIAGTGYALLLTDADGIVLCDKLDPARRHEYRSAGLVAGGDWNERQEGTNGIGTCIAEGKAVTVHRGDHFRSRHIAMSCTGVPIRHSDGTLAGVLDASTTESHDTRSVQLHTQALIRRSAALIEKSLFLHRHRGLTILRFHCRAEVVGTPGDGALALTDDRMIAAADDTALRTLQAGGRSQVVGRLFSDVFDADAAESCRRGLAIREGAWPLRAGNRPGRFFATLQKPERPTRYVSSPGAAGVLPYTEDRHAARGVRTHAMSLEEIAGTDPQMLHNVGCARKVADTDLSVILLGETGTGKEVFARALHLASARADQPFVAINCASIPETLIESELFGYRPGAFTGARKEGMKGKILQSSGGTLFLDEIGDMPLGLQTRLLRVLEDGEIVPLGSELIARVDLRVICASHRNLLGMVEQGEFREDLYYRLNGITISLPPLAQRADKERIIRWFLSANSVGSRPVAVDPAAFDCLMSYGWPGNIRQLRNVLRAASAVCDGGIIRTRDLPWNLRADERGGPSAADGQHAVPYYGNGDCGSGADASCAPDRNILDVAERNALVQVLDRHRWNVSQTAANLDISRNTLYRRMKRHGIARSQQRAEPSGQCGRHSVPKERNVRGGG